ncbi:hypothetical protein AAFC00_004425 [Neodothiora populina]|uniref:Uncharacterized protein n=1 Tax=Neodothiora populina TaxID=2781224 RepID=A0ABR3PQP2_9PEZI
MSSNRLSTHVGCLSAKEGSDKLTPRQQLYAHFMSRAAWHGTRIILRQVSPESIHIFDYILELYRACDGDWDSLQHETQVPPDDLASFLEYAVLFLSNVGNYYGHGDQKFVPQVPVNSMRQISTISSVAQNMYHEIEQAMMTCPPFGLGYPSENLQSSYYPGDAPMSQAEIEAVSKVLDERSIDLKNTRISRSERPGETSYNVLQASINAGESPLKIGDTDNGTVYIVRGDHSKELTNICNALEQAQRHAANPTQERYIHELRNSFNNGEMEPYKESQRLWVKDQRPAVETIMGFVEPYRDPSGVRAEFEGLVAIVDEDRTLLL